MTKVKEKHVSTRNINKYHHKFNKKICNFTCDDLYLYTDETFLESGINKEIHMYSDIFGYDEGSFREKIQEM